MSRQSKTLVYTFVVGAAALQLLGLFPKPLTIYSTFTSNHLIGIFLIIMVIQLWRGEII